MKIKSYIYLLISCLFLYDASAGTAVGLGRDSYKDITSRLSSGIMIFNITNLDVVLSIGVEPNNSVFKFVLRPYKAFSIFKLKNSKDEELVRLTVKSDMTKDSSLGGFAFAMVTVDKSGRLSSTITSSSQAEVFDPGQYNGQLAFDIKVEDATEINVTISSGSIEKPPTSKDKKDQNLQGTVNPK